MTCGKYMDPKIIISKYNERVESLKEVEGFDMSKRESYSLSFFGKTIQKSKVIISLLLLQGLDKKDTKYIFEEYRYPDVINEFHPSDCTIIGGVRDLFKTIINGHRFVWGGGITSAFEIALWRGEYKHLNNIIKVIEKLNVTNYQYRLLFLSEDTLPLGIVLSSIFKDSKHVQTICIQHGMFHIQKHNKVLPEGHNSNINFLWHDSQSVLFDTKQTHVITLGVPFKRKKILSRSNKRIILVGHCSIEFNTFEFITAYAHLFKVYNILKTNQYTVKFKAHPRDKSAMSKECFGSDLVFSLQEEIQRGSIFVGFTSSVLFEVYELGLVSIGLDTKDFSVDRAFDVSKEFKFSEYELIHKYINDSRESFGTNLLEHDDLSSRLKSSLSTAHKILSSNKQK